jgi:hypothetical protein
VILVCGIPSEPPVAAVVSALEALGVRHLVLDQRRFPRTEATVEVRGGEVLGSLCLDGRDVDLDQVTGVYTRMIDHGVLPEVRRAPPGSPIPRHVALLHEVLLGWLEITPARVLNRPAAMASNHSKPFQALHARDAGFAVPETIVTDDPAAVEAFWSEHGQVIYKSASGVRSIVQQLGEPDRARLPLVAWCPTQFQAYVPGRDVRVHVVGTEVFASAIQTDVVDYRYASRVEGAEAVIAPTELSGDVRAACIDLAHALDLPLAGIGLKLGPEGAVHCFEVNPSPAFTYYEAHTGQPIARAIARYLAAGAQGTSTGS